MLIYPQARYHYRTQQVHETMATDGLKEPTLIVSIKSAGVALVELNRPRKRNALSQELMDELTSALSQLDRSPTVRRTMCTAFPRHALTCGMSRYEPLFWPVVASLRFVVC